MARERRIRIGDWLVPYDDAKQEVALERTLKDVLTAKPGDHENCMNTRCIMAQRRERVFPHPVYLVSTIKSRVYIVDEMDDSGLPMHAIRYELSKRDSRLIGEHDKFGVGEPGVLRLRVPTVAKGEHHNGWEKSGRYDSSSSRSYKGKTSRTVTSVGAKARFKVAVGAALNS